MICNHQPASSVWFIEETRDPRRVHPGFFDCPTQNLWEGGYPPPLFYANTKVKSKLNHETCHQGNINSWLCYSLLGEALVVSVIPRSLPLVDISKKLLVFNLSDLTHPQLYNPG